MPTSPRSRECAEPTETRCASAISARMPPSPRLSARMIKVTYLTVTISISDQKISDRMPRISTLLIATPWKISRLAFRA